MEPLEWTKKLVSIGHIEARTIVADKKYRLPVKLGPVELDASSGVLGGELPGVDQQVLQCDLEQVRIAPSAESVGNVECHRTLGISALQALGDTSCHAAQIHRRALHLDARET